MTGGNFSFDIVLGPREQLNQNTAFLDASQIYGSDLCIAYSLRSFSGGKLNVTSNPIRGKDLLPQSHHVKDCESDSGKCFQAGKSSEPFIHPNVENTFYGFKIPMSKKKIGIWFQNIFPLANGENKGNFVSRLWPSLNIPNSKIYETRPYFKFTATNRMSEKNLWAEIFGPKVGKVGYF